MNKMFAVIIGLAMLTAAPLGVMAQISEPSPAIEPDVTIEPYWYYMPEMGGFDYVDGVANGTYVDFLLDEATGTVTEYTCTIVDYNYFYPMVYASGESVDGGEGYGYTHEWGKEPTEYVVNFFDTVAIGGFVPNGQPFVFRESLVYLGNNVMVTLTDYEYSSIYMQFGEANDTITFTVPEGIEISDRPHYYDLYEIGIDERIGQDDMDSGGTASADYYGFNEPPAPWYYGWDEAYLTSGNITCTIWVDRGSIDIVGNQIIISTYPGASVSTSSYIEYGWAYRHNEPWFEDVPTDSGKGALAEAIEQGLVAAIGYLFTDSSGARYNDAETMNDPSFQLKFMNVERNRFQVQVDSDIETGRIVTLNVNKETLDAENMKEVKVLLDNEGVKACGSMEELVNLQGGTRAGYYMVSGTSQNTIFVYVPHFSTHVITVGLDASQIVNILIPGAVAAAFVAAAVGMIMLRGKRNKDDI
jgi:hypothetical protein